MSTTDILAERHLFEAADALRGSVQSAEYKHCPRFRLPEVLGAAGGALERDPRAGLVELARSATSAPLRGPAQRHSGGDLEMIARSGMHLELALRCPLGVTVAGDATGDINRRDQPVGGRLCRA